MISNYLAKKLLDHTLRATSYTSPTAVYAALLQAIPLRGTATPASECSAGNYARVNVTPLMAAAGDDGRIANSAAVTFNSPNADWAPAATPVVAVALLDAYTSGNWLYAVPVCPYQINNGDPAPTFAIGGLLVAFQSLIP